MSIITQAKRVVVKVGTSTLTYENGKMNLRRIESLCKVLSGLQNSGMEIILVSSGAVGVGMGRLGIPKRPTEMEKKQAIAAVGQCELMLIYNKLFGEYNQIVAQILLTADDVASETSRQNIENTFLELIHMGIIPVVNENDTIATHEMQENNFGDNDTLSAFVATLLGADLLLILTDIDGLYNDNPRTNPQARRIPVVDRITPQIHDLAGCAGSTRGTGGMVTKVHAAEIATAKGIPCCVMSGVFPQDIYRLFDGEQIGTLFLASPKS